MEDMTKHRLGKIRLLIALAAAVAVVWAVSHAMETKDMETLLRYVDEEQLTFSAVSGFYTEGFLLEIKKDRAFPSEAGIYYTLDGSVPTERSARYADGGIALDTDKDYEVFTVRACVFFKGEPGDVYTQTYVLGSEAANRFDIPVVSVVSDDDGLFSEQRGILHDINSEEEWGRIANVTIFEKDRQCVVNQQVMMSVGGNGSRSHMQKTLNLKADKAYDAAHNRFNYDLWSFDGYSSSFPDVTSYKRLRLRNGGQDYLSTRLRSAFISRLAYASGLNNMVPVRPAVVFVNNAYYGLAEMQPVQTGTYLGDLYGIVDHENIEIYENSEASCLEQLGYPTDFVDYSADDEARQWLEETIDIKNALMYYAFEMFINNTDWPGNNVKMWRYTGKQDETNEYTDGKARFLLYDVDQSFGYTEDYDDMFDFLLYNDEAHEGWNFFHELMQYAPYKAAFVNILNDYLSTSMNEEHIEETLLATYHEFQGELTKVAQETPFEEVQAVMASWDESCNKLIDAAKRRGGEVRSYMDRYFETEDTGYTLAVKRPADDSIVRVSTVEVTGGASHGTYVSRRHSNHPVTMEAVVAPGRQFDCWLINETLRVTEEMLTVSSSFIENDRVSVRLCTKPLPGGMAVINEISSKENDDWIELYNPSEEPVILSGYYLSDDADNLVKYKCPETVLQPGEALVLNCENNLLLDYYVTNFSLQTGEAIYLYDGENIVDSIHVPAMSEGESYGRYLQSGVWHFFRQPTKGAANRESME